jgi:hypothetical protein
MKRERKLPTEAVENAKTPKIYHEKQAHCANGQAPMQRAIKMLLDS